VRLVACLLVFACLCLGGTGCALFNKKPGEGKTGNGGSKEPAKFPSGNGGGRGNGTSADPLHGGASPHTGDQEGLIAGTVIDKFNNRPKDAYVRWVCLDDPKKEEAPIDVAVSPEGYFTIRGLKNNGQYKLMARARDGNHMIAGVTYTKSPNIHVLIRLTEEGATADTPPLPTTPVYTKDPPPKKAAAAPADNKPATAQTPWGSANQAKGTVGNTPASSIPNLSAPIPIPPPAPATPAAGWVPGIVDNRTTWPPVGNINPPAKLIGTPIPIPGDSTAGNTSPNFTPTRVPSCVLVGNQLVNLALFDLNHQPWELKTNRRGKLVLLDFWGTMCLPCRESIPHLRILQEQYGQAGLEVVGIACEGGGNFTEEANKVQSVGQRLGINYRQLLSRDNCPVRNQFHIRTIPTLILIDENGWILWRSDSALNAHQREELELLIKRRLGV
jgi:thiol-disulfide isomerase/thioredoxin